MTNSVQFFTLRVPIVTCKYTNKIFKKSALKVYMPGIDKLV